MEQRVWSDVVVIAKCIGSGPMWQDKWWAVGPVYLVVTGFHNFVHRALILVTVIFSFRRIRIVVLVSLGAEFCLSLGHFNLSSGLSKFNTNLENDYNRSQQLNFLRLEAVRLTRAREVVILKERHWLLHKESMNLLRFFGSFASHRLRRVI